MNEYHLARQKADKLEKELKKKYKGKGKRITKIGDIGFTVSKKNGKKT